MQEVNGGEKAGKSSKAGEDGAEVNTTGVFEERLAGADSFIVLRRGFEIGLRRIGTGGDRRSISPGHSDAGDRFSIRKCLIGKNCVTAVLCSRPYPHTQHPSTSSVQASPYTTSVPLLPHLGQSATPFQGAMNAPLSGNTRAKMIPILLHHCGPCFACFHGEEVHESTSAQIRPQSCLC